MTRMTRLRAPWGRLFIAGFWLVMMALLFRREILPGLALAWRETDADQTYEALINATHRTRTARMGIYWPTLGNRVGTTTTTIRRIGDSHQISTLTNISVGVLGKLFLLSEDPAGAGDVAPDTAITVTSRALIGPKFQLVSFAAAATTSPRALRLMSIRARTAGGKLLVTVEDQAGRITTREVPYDPSSALSQSFSVASSPGGLQVGKRWQVRMLNPLKGSYETAVAEVARRTTLEWNGAPHDVFVVETAWGLSKAIAWVTPDGEVLRQRAPFGVMLVRDPPAEGIRDSEPQSADD